MKQFLGILVLTCMTLHCASRLGILTYIYQNRDFIAFSLGLIAEKPIAICSHKYEFSREQVVVIGDTHHTTPVLPEAREIQLFFVNISSFLTPKRDLLHEFKTSYLKASYHSLQESVFHPPAFS